ncbi:hypothetical protein LY90DRAFT_706924 [Neocallimastix californiae]|uniref:Coth-domain-containing protein n=1 Tax=Neocallimastix californiae TaxID=1754190 RepID=A0A1Y2AKR7_9FUNG|nr:hypothetical protein LY90DRAFT_706924 [Neocallimastix californiae]|eukprot:ORY23153.1 hypothetical protein LY90DRAFT_706924 [Neocallimastix californiae]
MKFSTLSLAFSSLVVFANAANWKFNVVSIKDPSYSMGLKYNNKVVKMKSEVFPLFTTTIKSGSSKAYKYVVLDKNGKVIEEESIKRTYTSETPSINEVYNRNNRKITLSSLPKVYDPLFDGYQDKMKEFDDTKIYSVYAKCDEDQYSSLKYLPFINPNKKNEGSANCTVNVITPTEVFQANGSLQLIGFDSRRYKKLSWKIKLDKKIFGRKTLKFRANANDVSFMRDKLSTELYKSLGVPTYSSAYTRVTINNDVYGLYSLVDTVGKNWIAAAIHGNDKARVGYSYKTYAGADLKYRGTTNKDWSVGTYEIDETDSSDTEAKGNDWYRLADFTKLYENWDAKYGNDQSSAATNGNRISYFAFDNFWANSGNFALYYNPEQNKYQINPYDFDSSFYGFRESPRFSKDYLDDPMDCIAWADNARNNNDNYFISRLFKHDLIKNRYNKIMSDTLSKLFNVEAISPFIDSVSNLIIEDIEWNFGLIDELDNKIPGYVNHYSLQNFKDNTNFKKVDYKPSLYRNEAEYGLKQWINLRGEECKKYVKKVGVQAEEDISFAEAEEEVAAPVKTTTTTTVAPVKTTTTTVVPVKTTTTTTVVPVKTTTTTTTTTVAPVKNSKKVVTVKKKVVVKKTKVVVKYVGKN